MRGAALYETVLWSMAAAYARVYAPRLTYGLPLAAGGVDRPMTPANAAIVSTYGNISRNSCGIAVNPHVWAVSWTASARAKSSAAHMAPRGVHLPNITAARAMKPRPELMPSRKMDS